MTPRGRVITIILRIFAVLLLIAALLWVWKREEISRLMAVNSLFDEDRIVANFSNMEGLFDSVQMRTDAPISPLPNAPRAAAMPPDVSDWLARRATTGLVVLSGGQVVYEDYFSSTGPDDKRISWSMAKSVLSAVFGIVMAEGAIESLDDPVTRYAAQLVGSAYDGASLRNVLQMSSGVAFNEDYLDPNSDINRMGRAIALGGSLDDFTAALTDRRADPGSEWHYVSMDTHVLGMVLRGATGRSIPELIEEKLLRPMHLEAAPYYIADGQGTAFVLGGLNMPTRDYARIGQMILQNGEWMGRQIVPADWIAASTTPSAPTAPGATQYGYQWWMPSDARPGEVFAVGVYGQYIYIDREAGVVIAINAADRNFTQDGVDVENIAKLRQITEIVR